MAYIQTTTRLIKVKETYEQVWKAMDFQWMELTEDCSFYSQMSREFNECEKKIKLNRDYIIEIHP